MKHLHLKDKTREETKGNFDAVHGTSVLVFKPFIIW